MRMKYCKIFCIYSALLIMMLGIWVEVSTAQTITATDMPNANLRAEVLRRLISKNIVPSTATTFTRADMANTGFTSLAANDREITNITGLEYATNLTELVLNGNNISDISALSGLTALTDLNLSDNNISDISVLSKLTALTRLDLSDNNISDISVLSKLTALTWLDLHGNKISNLDALVGLINLQILQLHSNRITDIGEFRKLTVLTSLTWLRLHPTDATVNSLQDVKDNNVAVLQNFLWTRPSAIDANRAVSSEDPPGDPLTETFPFTIRFSEPVFGFQIDDIIVETELEIGTGTATLEALTPTTEPEQTYIATIALPANAAGLLRVIVRAGATETDSGRIDPAVDRVFPWIRFSTIPVEEPSKRRIILECPVGWQRSDRFARPNPRVLLYEVNLEMDLQNRISIYKPTSVAIYVHPDEGLETLDGWKLKVAVPYNHHRDYLLTAENSVIVDANIEGVEGGFAFIENPEEDPFPMIGMGFTGALVPGFDYRLYDDTGRKVDFGIACYKRVGIFQALKDMEDPRVLRNVLLETLDWDAATYIRTEWTVPVPAPAAPSLVKKTVVGTWADLKKQ